MASIHLRGGTDSARARGDRHVSLNLSPAEYDALKAAAAKAGLSLKGFCRKAALKAAGLRETREDRGWGGKR